MKQFNFDTFYHLLAGMKPHKDIIEYILNCRNPNLKPHGDYVLSITHHKYDNFLFVHWKRTTQFVMLGLDTTSPRHRTIILYRLSSKQFDGLVNQCEPELDLGEVEYNEI